MNESIIYGIEDIKKVTDYLKKKMKTCSILAFYGPLGAGKTTLINNLLQACGIKGPITSPTFNYLNVYQNESGQTFYHFDLYRIDSVKDFFEAGFDEYLEQPNSWTLIEWPEVINQLLNDNVCHVTIDYSGPEKRVLSCETK